METMDTQAFKAELEENLRVEYGRLEDDLGCGCIERIQAYEFMIQQIVLFEVGGYTPLQWT